MLTINSHGVEISIAGCVREMVGDPNVTSFFFSFFSFFSFFYHEFIVFKYKKLRAALAMERTKPINQNKKPKKHVFLSPTVTESTLGLKPSAQSSED